MARRTLPHDVAILDHIGAPCHLQRGYAKLGDPTGLIGVGGLA
jgi:hypothetical protein